MGEFTHQDEYELGKEFEILVRSRMPLLEDPEITNYAKSLVERLAEVIPPQPFPFTVGVFLHNSLNAFAVPGGFVFLNTGLIMAMEHESDLVGVLAHELAHVTQRHIADRIEKAQLSGLASTLGALAGALIGGEAGQGLIVGSLAANQASMLHYSRQNENEADEVGLRYMTEAGYNPLGMKRAFEVLRRSQWTRGIDIPEYLSTHPDLGNRVSDMHRLIQAFEPSVTKRPEKDEAFLRVRTLVQARYGDVDMAEHYLKKLPENNPLGLMGKALLAERRNRYAEAKALFEKAVQLAPKDYLIVREAGRFYFVEGNPKAGITLQRALQLNPDDIMAQFFLARVMNGKKDYAQAHKLFAEVLRYLPKDSEVHYYYARSLGESGRPFEAYLHLAYAALYQNNPRKVQQWIGKTKQFEGKLNQKQERDLKDFEKALEERQKFWK